MMTASLSADLGLLVLRLLLGGVFFAHATQKLLGWFSGGGLDAAAAGFERMGQHPGRLMAALAAGSELGAGALIGSGAAAPLGTAVGLGTMLVAGASVTQSARAFWNAQGGGEYPAFIGAVLVSLAFLGPGGLSLDALLDAPWQDMGDRTHAMVGIVVVASGAVAAVPVVLRARRRLALPRRAGAGG